MPIKSLVQGSQAWLDYRLNHLMGTDASICSGSNPFESEIDLWKRKLLMIPPIEKNAAMQRGNDLECAARELACKEIGLEFEPVVYESDEHSWAAASLDGYNADNNVILEIKCPSEKTYFKVLSGYLPQYYNDQINWQLMVTGAKLCYFFNYRPEHPIINTCQIVQANLERQQFLLEKCREFYRKLCNFEAPVEWILDKKGN